MAHITLNAVSCNDFNVDPDRYLKDAEGNYRVDSVYWGTCYYSEPDLSGKAYYALKNYIGNGYGFGIGHDTMYAYAGAMHMAVAVATPTTFMTKERLTRTILLLVIIR